MEYILAIDQGTSSTKTLVFDREGKAVAKGHVDLQTNYYDNGFVEQDPEGIYKNVLDSLTFCIQTYILNGFELSQIKSCGISNQRETFLLWDQSGLALSPAIVWACKRSVSICQDLVNRGQDEWISQKTGLKIDPYFSATKLLWLIYNDPELKKKVQRGEVYFGTVDCWLLYKLTGGKVYKTDHTNAHRTLLFNIKTLDWDKEILAEWGLENLHLPEVCASSASYGNFQLDLILDLGIGPQSVLLSLPVTALIGDSHAASFGEGCFEQGTAKVTLGTGSSIMMNTGREPIFSGNGMLTTICFSSAHGVSYALEGAIVACGSTIEWLRNELSLFDDLSETSRMASEIPDNAGVYLIPAFSGLGAPHWQMDRRASLEGMTFGTTKNHIVRAALESIPYQIKDVIGAMRQDMGADLHSISVNGGLTKNDFVIRFLVDLLGIPLNKQENPDVSALGAAYLAGLESGIFPSLNTIQKLVAGNSGQIIPNSSNEMVVKGYQGWLEKI
ncbi:FGGY family carbohydrate kinase [Dyadobacter tibetensis]|uniref:FGGY family carbohydrate kinase n=1 Tax=Dyadobacter tibetensis TaxID=1211851 RepID=UPI0004B4FE47|nr:glycerol kinase GlpK [Dyadobacter tibetensis]